MSQLQKIRDLASNYPGAEKAFLFGDHEVYRVNRKVFVWLGDEDKPGTWLSVKLKQTQQTALMLPFVTPSAYGMAKWGWVNADFPKGKLPVTLVAQWIDESYRHTAPKKLLAQLAGASAAKPKKPAKAKARRTARR